MNSRISSFLDNVCVFVKCKAAHKEIRDELGGHILELTEQYQLDGLSEGQAVENAIAQMGTVKIIGERLNREHRPQTEWTLIALGGIIAIIGGIIMFASSKFNNSTAIDFGKYLVFMALGIGALVGTYFFDYTKLRKAALPIYIAAIFLVGLILFLGTNVMGRAHFRIGGFAVSNEYLFLLYTIAFAGFLEKYGGQGVRGLAKLIILGGISLLSLLMIPSMGMTFVLLSAYAALTITAVAKEHFGGSKKAQYLILGGISAAVLGLFAILILQAPYRMGRFTSFLTGWKSDPTGMGWQQNMADTWLSMSAWFGKTAETYYGQGIERTLPRTTTDYVLINVIATLGWIVGVLLICVIAVFILRLFLTTKKVKNNYGFYLSLCACTILSAQFIISILMNLNLFPAMGISMPFVSYGGTGYVVSMVLVGIVLSVWRRNKIIGKKTTPASSNKSKFVAFEDGKLIINFK